MQRFELYRHIEPLLAAPRHEDVATYIEIIEAFVAQAARIDHVRTTVLFAPFEATYLARSGYTEADIVGELRRAGLDVLVDHLPAIADPGLYTIADDGHPTALANRARAAEVEAHLRQVDPAALGP